SRYGVLSSRGRHVSPPSMYLMPRGGCGSIFAMIVNGFSSLRAVGAGEQPGCAAVIPLSFIDMASASLLKGGAGDLNQMINALARCLASVCQESVVVVGNPAQG